MQIIVDSIGHHPNGSGNASYQVLFKVVRDREYKKMMATIFYSGEEVGALNRCRDLVNIVNLDKLTDHLDPDYFPLVHKAVAQWYKSWDGTRDTQSFPFIVSP